MTINIYREIGRLLQYGIQKNLITPWDLDVTRNSILDILGLDDFKEMDVPEERLDAPVEILENMLDWAAEEGLLEENSVTYRDLLDTKIMGVFAPSQTEVIRTFAGIAEEKGPEAATQAFYQFSKDVFYIRTDRIAKNEQWLSPTKYGDMEITINLSKPEKDPKAIAAAKKLKESGYPKCLLCKENAGYRGRVNHPARQNHRIIPVKLRDEQWFLQYSPYVYYNEHAIVFSGEHKPMKISGETFSRLLDFVDQFPHYFVGSNADLPIVGGSILTHDHFQGGNHEFPMAAAEIEREFSFPAFPGAVAGIVKWPMSVIRIVSDSKEELVRLSEYILEKWRIYSDPSADLYAFSGDTPHNTITPIARRRGRKFEMDLVLRNNRTSEEHPMGIFHPHAEVHHIKQENIGLIEVMGLAVLPGRLKEELYELAAVLHRSDAETVMEENELIQKHAQWALKIKAAHPEMNEENSYGILQQEVGKIFSTILEHAGVYKRNQEGQAAFAAFTDSIIR
ncbi:UDP-glucose--hexose-1-phosphate uridylyltransferase [Bacillus lacus]|uniref:Galactose-1-phosphate uridylyltransferase n=1 Tax=Metabacillus lacus TaxID=1983721 RepID=A0A7X2LYQ5_9BACI|nr:UDP-glucose--hexose-1-phosphate uridylyltransferase [Metabacillus lacus]MRX71152.1 UDP-glucose--hexose-1-phosphate uridylyltransferase [Metabacillus lacus]